MDYSEVLRSEGGREFSLSKPVTEDNWKLRMNFCNNMTEAISTYDAGDRLPHTFHAQIEPYLYNLLECARSERTQLSISACKLLGALPKVLKRDIHPDLDKILPDLLKLCANTKQVIVKVAATAVVNIVQYATYSPRLLWHVCQVFEDKPAGPKQNGTAWLQTILKEYHKHVNNPKDLEMISRALLLALEDADAQVRTNIRATYWTYNKIDPDGAATIMEKINPHARTALQNDPHNPTKKAGVKKEPPRPRSALADVRKEQARKKRAEEEEASAQKQPKLPTSDATNAHSGGKDQNETTKHSHEPRHPKAGPAVQTSTDRTVEEWQPAKNSTMAVASHKKTLSQDNEAVAKSSTNSRLLSAPVRRPRINVTPMNATNNTRPSSRTGHTTQAKESHLREAQPKDSQLRGHSTKEYQAKETQRKPTHTVEVQPKEVQKDLRPASSSSSKSAIVGASTTSNVPSPQKSASKISSPRTASTAKPRARVPYVPDGKENRTIASEKKAHNSPPTDPVNVPVRNAFQAKQYDPYLQNTTSPRPEETPFERQIPIDFKAALNYHKRQDVLSRYPENHEPQVPAPDEPGYVELGSAQRFIVKVLNDIDRVAFDPLGCRKLRSILMQHKGDLITDERTYDMLFEQIAHVLANVDHIDPDATNAASASYNRQVLLQITVTLFQHYPLWSRKHRALWIETMIYYRCTLPYEPLNRSTLLCLKNIDAAIKEHEDPLEFINPVMNAIFEGERIILEASKREEAFDISADPSSYNPFCLQSKWKYAGEVAAAGMPQCVWPDFDMKPYMVAALHQHNAETLKKDITPYPKMLGVLLEFSLEVLTKILSRAKEMEDCLSYQQEHQLGELADYCLKTYDYMVKKAVIPFVKALYIIMRDERRFFGHFQDEGERNLVEYYVFTADLGRE